MLFVDGLARFLKNSIARTPGDPDDEELISADQH